MPLFTTPDGYSQWIGYYDPGHGSYTKDGRIFLGFMQDHAMVVTVLSVTERTIRLRAEAGDTSVPEALACQVEVRLLPSSDTGTDIEITLREIPDHYHGEFEMDWLAITEVA